MFVEVAVENAVYSFDKPFTYEIPVELEDKIKAGMRVTVPFGAGNKPRVGAVLSLIKTYDGITKPIISVLDKESVLSSEMIELVYFIKEKYFCTLFDAVKIMLPTGLNYKLKNSYLLNENFKDFDRDNYTDIQWNSIMLIKKSAKAVPFETISKELGILESNSEFTRLIESEIIHKVNTTNIRIKDAVSKMLRPIPEYVGKLTPRQKDAYNTLIDVGSVSEKELRYFTGVSASVLRTMEKNGAIESFEYEVYRRPALPSTDDLNEKNNKEIVLSENQQEVYESLLQEMHEKENPTALLYGVTGSGKTSVFMKLIQSLCGDENEDKGAIVMVPEISLTSQTIKLFSDIFGDEIAVFHSGLSLGERLDEWKRVNRGEARIVVGTRSAVFAPVKNLALIVIDEEQEHTYKSESSPRYDAREIARWRCKKHSAMCLLTSATPSVESFYIAQKGLYSLHKLEERFGEAQLPDVELVDMNETDTIGADSLISVPLYEALKENIEEKRQSIILLNRRGYHHFATCKSCKEVIMCPYCSISMTYHSANGRLMCHYCGHSEPVPKKCPSCGAEDINFRGPGTQRVEEELEMIFPNARILRVDTDSMSAKLSLEKKLKEFDEGKYDIMVGTQMVAKGLDFENVTLVGVISADQMLYSDDFRSNERTFDLLTQVVGRSGRGALRGTAIIQTYVPENPFLYLASKQDYLGFYEREIEYRKALLYPPFADIMLVGFVGESERNVRVASEFFMNSLGDKAQNEYPKLPLRILRASPAAIVRMSGKYRYKIIIKCRNTAEFRKMVSELLISFAKNKNHQSVTAYADSNPYTII